MIVGYADQQAMRRSVMALINAHGVTDFDPEPIPTDLTETEADAFARDLERIRKL